MPDLAPADRVESRRRLVEQQQPRAADETCTQVQPTALSAGVRATAAVGDLPQAELVDHPGGSPPASRSAVAEEARRHLEVLPAGHRGLDRGELTSKPDVTTDAARRRVRRRGREPAARHRPAAPAWPRSGRTSSCLLRSARGSASTWPGGAMRSSPSRAVTFPNRTVSPRASRSGAWPAATIAALIGSGRRSWGTGPRGALASHRPGTRGCTWPTEWPRRRDGRGARRGAARLSPRCAGRQEPPRQSSL